MAKENDLINCIDCGRPIEYLINGVFPGSIRTDGNKNIIKHVPGGIMYGTVLGYVCCECSIFGKEYQNET